MLSLINNIDNIILFSVNNFFDVYNSVIIDKLMILLTNVGDKGLIWFLISSVFLINKRTRACGIMILIALITAAIFGDIILKNIIKRQRPFIIFPDIALIIKMPGSFSFPSGHSAMSYAAAYVLGSKYKKYFYLYYLLAALIAFSRIYLFMHYPSDIIAGIVLGIICGWVAIHLYKLIFLNNKIKIISKWRDTFINNSYKE